MPKESLFYSKFYRPGKDGTPKKQYVTAEGNIVFTFYEQGPKGDTDELRDDFVDPRTGNFQPLMYDDDSFVMLTDNSKDSTVEKLKLQMKALKTGGSTSTSTSKESAFLQAVDKLGEVV